MGVTSTCLMTSLLIPASAMTSGRSRLPVRGASLGPSRQPLPPVRGAAVAVAVGTAMVHLDTVLDLDTVMVELVDMGVGPLGGVIASNHAGNMIDIQFKCNSVFFIFISLSIFHC